MSREQLLGIYNRIEVRTYKWYGGEENFVKITTRHFSKILKNPNDVVSPNVC